MELRTEFPLNEVSIESCCGQPTHIDLSTFDIRMFTNPPRIAARYIRVSRWQCCVTPYHHGMLWDPVLDETVEHANVFGTEIDEHEIGDEIENDA